MALATQCPHCNTTFRVAADQLKLRGGIVRCGACHEVFDGNATLVDLDAPPAEAAPPVAEPAPEAVTASEELVPEPTAPEAAAPEAAVPDTAAPEAAAPEVPAADAPADEEPVYTLHFDRTFHPLGNLPNVGPEPEPVPAPEPTPPPPPPLNIDFTLELDAPPPAPAVPEAFEPEADDAEPAPAAQAPGASADEAAPDEEIIAEAISDPEPEPIQESAPEIVVADDAENTIPNSDDALSDADPAAQESPDGLASETPRARSRAKTRARARARAPVVAADFPETELLHSHQHDELPPPEAAPDAEAAPEAEHEEPGFVKRAKRAERMGRVWRILMLTGSVLLVLALAAQGVTTFRNQIAALYPQFNPALARACATLGCTLELPTQTDALAIETGELQTLGGDNFALTTQLRNQSVLTQAWPHIELVLTDANDKPVLRRVLRPADYLPPATDRSKGFAAHSEQAIKLYFAVSQAKASGYRLAVFYP